ncbi:MAG TPA: hypothetical protein VFW78_05725 [Bacteroidia bacterium]|nr:hypothetical protein [Bacteroidia bacterium]
MHIATTLMVHRIRFGILLLVIFPALESCTSDNETGSHWTKIESSTGNSDAQLFTSKLYVTDTLFFNTLQSGEPSKGKKNKQEVGSGADCANQFILGENMHVNLFLPKRKDTSEEQNLANLIKTAYQTYMSYTADTITSPSKRMRLPVNIMAYCGSDSIIDSHVYITDGNSVTEITHE